MTLKKVEKVNGTGFTCTEERRGKHEERKRQNKLPGRRGWGSHHEMGRAQRQPACGGWCGEGKVRAKRCPSAAERVS